MGKGKDKKEYILRVREAKKYEATRGKVRIPERVLRIIGADSGDVVEIVGRRKTVAIAWPALPEDEDEDIIRMDGILRKNAEVSVNEKVVVRKVEAQPATQVKFSLGSSTIEISRSEASIKAVKRRLLDYALVEGDIVPLQLLGSLTLLYTVQTKPSGPVIITEDTKIVILDKPSTFLKLPKVTYEDIGGMRNVVEKIRELVELPLKHPELFRKLGIEPPKGILLYGPPGCGKTLLAKAVATESGANFIAVKGPEILSKWVGESEKAVREIFRKARTYAPAVVFFDEIDAIAPMRGDFGDSHVAERVVSQLLTELDSIERLRNVVVIAATNRPDLVDPALLRPGRFEKLIYVKHPDEAARVEILKTHTRRMPLGRDVDLSEIAARTEGFSGADLAALVREAALVALRENINAKKVMMRHFEKALTLVKPSLSTEIIRFYEEWSERTGRRLPRSLSHPLNL